jgi:hypothetical protein
MSAESVVGVWEPPPLREMLSEWGEKSNQLLCSGREKLRTVFVQRALCTRRVLFHTPRYALLVRTLLLKRNSQRSQLLPDGKRQNKPVVRIGNDPPQSFPRLLSRPRSPRQFLAADHSRLLTNARSVVGCDECIDFRRSPFPAGAGSGHRAK